MKIEEIAELAGVSTSSVSIALNNKPGISEETREKIIKIANEYNYVPLRKKKMKKNDLYFIIYKNDFLETKDYDKQPFFFELINELSDAAGKYKFHLFIETVNRININEVILNIKDTNTKSAVIILGTSIEPSIIKNIKSLISKMVILDVNYTNLNTNFISVNNTQGSYDACEYLISLGHRKIGYIKGEDRFENYLQRYQGFNQALDDYNIDLNKNYILQSSGSEIHYDIKLERELLSMTHLPTAFFCENDSIAISLVKLLEKNGVRVPGDISVIGFDDINECKVVTPELTTIRVHKKQIIIAALETLSTNNYKFGRHILINTKLIKRNSTSAPRKI